MNQFTPKSAFQAATLLRFGVRPHRDRSFSAELRRLAAQFQMHHAIIHRLAPLEVRLIDTTYCSTLRNLEQSAWTLGDLMNQHTMDALLAGHSAVAWFQNMPNNHTKDDLLDRLNIQFGVSVPFHNALGNHVALTLCDSAFSSLDLEQLTRLATPLIDEVMKTERASNFAATALTTRETDCLQWAAAGKTSLETGIILGLSPHTVNQYLSEATLKLKAVNRTHAVTKAVRLGLINLSAV